MKPWHALAMLAVILAASFVGFVQHREQESLPQIEAQRMLLGLRADAHYDETWDQARVKAALEEAGFTIVFEDEFNLHAQRGENGTLVKVLPMGEGVLFHAFYELDEPVPMPQDGAAESDPSGELEADFRALVAAFEDACGWRHASLSAEPIVTDG